jgi:hypothetical protein
MTKSRRRINSLQSLDKEIYRLKLEAKRMEEKMDENFDQLQENFFSMTLNSLLHRRWKNESWSTNIVAGLLNNERLQNALSKLISYAAEKTGEGLDALLNRIFMKKES